MATNEAVAEPLEQQPPSPLQQQRAGERNLAPAPPSAVTPTVTPDLSPEAALATSQEKFAALADDYQAGMREADARYQKAEDDYRAYMERRRAALQPAREAYEAQLGRQLPKPPEPAAEPPVPDTGARPFLEGLPGESTTATLQRMLTGISLIAQMGVGIGKGYANGALAAYSGALQGWQAGDKQRAENDWHQYLQQVGSMQREYKNRRRAYDDVMETYKWDLQKAQLHLGMKAAELGEEKEGVDLAFKSHDAFLKKLQLSGTMLTKLNEDVSRATMQVLLAREKAATDARLRLMEQESRDNRADLDRRSREMIAQNALAIKSATVGAKPVYPKGGGMWYDKRNGTWLPYLEQSELAGDRENYHPVPWKNKNLVGFIESTAEPQITRLRTLVQQLNAINPGANLQKQLQLAVEGKLAMNPELREAMLLNRDLVIELARALGGDGQLRIKLMEALEKDVGLKTSDTVATGLRALDSLEWTLHNRKSELLGLPIKKQFDPTPRSDDPLGQRAPGPQAPQPGTDPLKVR